MREIGVGIVGAGFIARAHAYGIRTLPLYYEKSDFRARLIGVCSRTTSGARRLAQELEAPVATDRLDDLLNDERIDAICLCSPNATHEEYAIRALNAGKHVYCEKPLSVEIGGARRIEEAWLQSGKIGQMVFHNRFFPCIMRARQLIEAGRVGRVLSFRITFLHSSSVNPHRATGWKNLGEEGGVLLDLGSHAVDLLEWLAGDIVRVSARTVYAFDSRPDGQGGMWSREQLGEDAIVMLAELSGGAVGTLEASKIATGVDDGLKIEVHGTEGAISIDVAKPNQMRFFDQSTAEAPLGGERGWLEIQTMQRYPAPGDGFVPKNGIGWTRAHAHSIFTFLEHIASGSDPQDVHPSIADGRRNQEVMEAVRTSAQQKQEWVTVGGVPGR